MSMLNKYYCMKLDNLWKRRLRNRNKALWRVSSKQLRVKLIMDQKKVRRRIKGIKKCRKTSKISLMNINATQTLKIHYIPNQPIKCSHKPQTLSNNSTIAMTFTNNNNSKMNAVKAKLISSIIKPTRKILSLFDIFNTFFTRKSSKAT